VFHGSHDEFDWTVTVADTGLSTMTGGRIKQVEKYLNGDPFLATYGDGLADIDLKALTEFHKNHGKTATMTTTQATSRFGVVDIDSNGLVSKFREKPKVSDWINIGYFIFEPEIFNYLGPNSVLEEEPLRKLAKEDQIGAYQHGGFWQPMDTFRESQMLNEIWDSGKAPWRVWS
jgi:glucose-1-phosphate cytidylyltransferase